MIFFEKKTLKNAVALKCKTKVPGISLMIAFLTSMLVLALALVTLASIVRSFERTVGIERGNKVFFAAESGIEAAFYHKNARQSSVHFDWQDWEDGASASCDTATPSADCLDQLKSVEIYHPGTDTQTRWKVLSRFIPVDGPDIGSTIGDDISELTYTGQIAPFQNAEIPLFYDAALHPTDDYDDYDMIIEEGAAIYTVQFSFDPDNTFNTDMTDTVDNGHPFNFGDNREINNSQTFTAQDLANNGERREQLAFDWSISRTNLETNQIQNFAAERNIGIPCYQKDASGHPSFPSNYLICEEELLKNTVPTIALNDPVPGEVRPCTDTDPSSSVNTCEQNLDAFVLGSDISPTTDRENYKIAIQSLAPLEHQHDSTGNIVLKESGIDYNVIIPLGAELPLPYYTIVSNVTRGDYQKEISFDVNESTSIGAFSYVIFE